MKNYNLFTLKKLLIPNILASFSMAFAVLGANTMCCCIFHQPQMPDLKKLRKY